MALRGHVFNKQLFSSECFALFIDTFLNKNCGVIKGCEVTNTANNLTIGEGFFCLKGRFLEEEGGTTFDIESTVGSETYCKLICEIDMSQENSTSELKQACYKILKDSNNYPGLTQEDITDNGTIYQFAFAQFKITENGVEEFKDIRTFLDFDSIYGEIRNGVQELLNAIEQQKSEFFNTLNITTKEEANQLIKDLQEYCEEVQHSLDGDVAVNLLNQINELKKTQIIVSEEEPNQDCIWFKELSNTPVNDIAEIMLETADAYDPESTYQLETITNMTDNDSDENKVIENNI